MYSMFSYISCDTEITMDPFCGGVGVLSATTEVPRDYQLREVLEAVYGL